MTSQPFNLLKWINDNRDLLKPPVGNKVLFENADFIIMAVGGPNARTDFHFNEGEEFFYQLEGSIRLDIQQEGKLECLQLNQGDVFLLPPRTPHRPIRGENTVGLVVERKRAKEELDGLLWYCPSCNELLFDQYFKLESIEKDFIPVFAKFNQSLALRTCKKCGTIHPADPRYLA